MPLHVVNRLHVSPSFRDDWEGVGVESFVYPDECTRGDVTAAPLDFTPPARNSTLHITIE